MFSAFKKFGRMGAGSSIPWTPTKLFAAGEAGGLWDFSTLANLYQDSAGTTPCTAVGDPIGKVLDTSGRGNHLTQATSTKRPLLGRMPATGVRNLLTYTEDLTNGAWSSSDLSTLQKNSVGHDGTANSAWTLTDSPGSAVGYCLQSVTFTAQTYTASCWFKKTTGSLTSFPILSARMSSPATRGGVFVDTTNITVTPWTSYTGENLLSVVGAITDITATHFRVSITFTAIAGTGFVMVAPAWSNTYSGVGDRVATATGSVIVDSLQLELGSTATAYQKVGAAYDVTESGVASVYTAYFDGVDDCLVSPSIDFTAVSSVTTFIGASGLASSMQLMMSFDDTTTANSPGSFYESKSVLTSNRFATNLAGGTEGWQLTDTSIDLPAAFVAAVAFDMGDASSTEIRLNGVARGTTPSGETPLGTFGNYPIQAGARNNTLFTQGFLSALCTRGAATDAATVTSMEKWLAARTPGVTLP